MTCSRSASVILSRSGSQAQPITIRGVRINGNRPVLSGGTNTIEVQSNWTVIESFEFTAGSFRCFYHHADHVTLRPGATQETPLPREVEARVVGRADDGESLECLVVELDGTTDRPDGSTYHITWSLGAGRRAVQSNDVLRDLGWKHIPEPIPIEITPARF